jgi:hypothetical protein
VQQLVPQDCRRRLDPALLDAAHPCHLAERIRACKSWPDNLTWNGNAASDPHQDQLGHSTITLTADTLWVPITLSRPLT